MNKAVFLDRDGVINENRFDYVKSVAEFKFLPSAAEAIRLLNSDGFLVVIVTNQSAVNRGLLSIEELEKIHHFMLTELSKYGCRIDAIYYCPHKPDENCSCRKPQPGLLKKAILDLSVDPKFSWLIGDSDADEEAARKAGINSVIIRTNGNLLDAVKGILGK
ncbi:MAG: D-glycero-beta-D-manno-heptose 1,7-bisphosphate 7-phosphatase [Nitrososphaerales archaeon]